jgi:hypothetical protein
MAFTTKTGLIRVSGFKKKTPGSRQISLKKCNKMVRGWMGKQELFEREEMRKHL